MFKYSCKNQQHDGFLSDCQIMHMHYSSLLAGQLQLNKQMNRGVVVVLVKRTCHHICQC